MVDASKLAKIKHLQFLADHKKLVERCHGKDNIFPIIQIQSVFILAVHGKVENQSSDRPTRSSDGGRFPSSLISYIAPFFSANPGFANACDG